MKTCNECGSYAQPCDDCGDPAVVHDHRTDSYYCETDKDNHDSSEQFAMETEDADV
jgi:hypothetical protein